MPVDEAHVFDKRSTTPETCEFNGNQLGKFCNIKLFKLKINKNFEHGKKANNFIETSR